MLSEYVLPTLAPKTGPREPAPHGDRQDSGSRASKQPLQSRLANRHVGGEDKGKMDLLSKEPFAKLVSLQRHLPFQFPIQGASLARLFEGLFSSRYTGDSTGSEGAQKDANSQKCDRVKDLQIHQLTRLSVSEHRTNTFHGTH